MAVGKSASGRAARYDALHRVASTSEAATWEDASPEDLWRTVMAITNAGDAVTLGRTRDGGALSLVILSGDDRIRRYAHGEEEVAELLREIRQTLEATD